MNISASLPGKRKIIYPDSDGKPMADNTLQYRWIVTIQGGLDVQFRQDANVFVAGDLLWYPVEGHPEICTAPDVMVALGRPKGDRGSYKQWEEEGVPPQVVFEVLSPTNRHAEMIRKFRFYERYGVEEYYVYDPDRIELAGWQRADTQLQEIPAMNGWISPRLGIRFDLSGEELHIFGADGRLFISYLDLAQQRDEEARQKELAQRQAAEATERAERLAARLRELGIDPQQ
jgi:Uma2 family endonuclease